MNTITAEALHRALCSRDLTDPDAGPHAMQLIVDTIVEALRTAWACRVVVHRTSPLTTVADNYDRLHYPREGVARDARYTRWVCERTLLRSHATAMIPPLLRTLAGARVDDVLLVCPGVVYRRDCIDRLHAGEPHQVDLWRLRGGSNPLDATDLESMVDTVTRACVPDRGVSTVSTEHPYTTDGREIQVDAGNESIEIGECGVASRAVLREAGLADDVSGLAMGLGLDRLLMLRKGLDDIRLLRAEDPRIREQMLDLSPYRAVSRQPAIRRDLSIAIAQEVLAEELGDRVRAALGDAVRCVESIELVAETAYDELPPIAIERLGMRPGQKNALVRVVLRDLDRSLTHPEANVLRDRIYAALHEGTVYAWAACPP
jgi:phenylalanyl-tRNA synthetase alpha chain